MCVCVCVCVCVCHHYQTGFIIYHMYDQCARLHVPTHTYVKVSIEGSMSSTKNQHLHGNSMYRELSKGIVLERTACKLQRENMESTQAQFQ